jgi:uncharacterized protein YkwD
MCALAAMVGSVLLAAIAGGAIRRYRSPWGHLAQRRRVLRRRICAGANLVPNASNIAAAQSATLCLVNRERSAWGLAALANDRVLEVVAMAHSWEMVARNYFSHRSPSGATAQTRILASGYARFRDRVATGENVATAGGELATPASVVQEWMSSPGHRANLLSAGFRASGVGIALGMPQSSAGGWQGPGATYTEDLGSYR